MVIGLGTGTETSIRGHARGVRVDIGARQSKRTIMIRHEDLVQRVALYSLPKQSNASSRSSSGITSSVVLARALAASHPRRHREL